MITFLIVLLYFVNVAFNVAALRSIDIRRLTFMDGVVLGLTYYVTIPFAVILLYGRIGSDFLMITDYLPYEDVETTGVILMGSMAVSSLKLVVARFRLKSAIDQSVDRGGSPDHQRRQQRTDFESAKRYRTTLLLIILGIYFAFTTFFFIRSGVSEGDHWYHAQAELMAESPVFVLLKYFANYARTAVFGVLALLVVFHERYKWRFALIGTFVSVADLLMTLNRITVVYLAVLLIVVMRRRIYAGLSALSVTLASGIYLSSLWPEFRGQISNFGYSVEGFTEAFAKAVEVNAVSKPFVDQMNGMFESFSFTVLNWIVQHYDSISVEPGSYITRPLTVVIPRSIWSDRPESFALIVGRHFSKTELALNSYVFGEPFANSWFLWPLLLAAAILVYEAIYRQMSKRDPVWGFIGALIGFAWWRFDSSFLAMSMLIGLSLFGIMQILYPNRKAQKRAASARHLRPQPTGPRLNPLPRRQQVPSVHHRRSSVPGQPRIG